MVCFNMFFLFAPNCQIWVLLLRDACDGGVFFPQDFKTSRNLTKCVLIKEDVRGSDHCGYPNS